MTSVVLPLAKIPNEIFLLLVILRKLIILLWWSVRRLLLHPWLAQWPAKVTNLALFASSPLPSDIYPIRILFCLEQTERLLSSAPDCQSARCGMDAGCLKQEDGLFICVCTHDLSQEIPGKICPRKIVSGTSSQYPVTNKTVITIHRSRGDYEHGFKALPTVSGPDENSDHSSSIKAVALAYAVPITLVLALIGLAFLSVRLIRWIKIYRMTNRTRPALHFGRNVVQKEFLTINTDYLKIVNQAEQSVSSVSFILLREWIELDNELGEGCFGKVFRGRLRLPSLQPPDPSYINVDVNESCQTVAIKVLKSPSPGIASTTAKRDLLREAETMASFSHENILTFLGIVINEFSIGPWVVFEYMELGDLAQLLRSTNGYPNPKEKDTLNPRHSLNQALYENLRSIAEQIANGMKYLSSRHFVHRDLACRNCLVGERPSVIPAFANNSSNLIVKISDFGMSRDVHTTDYYKMGGSRFLPVRWMSPESILYGKFSPASDVWSFGVVLWEIFSMGAQPYYGHSNEEVIKMIVDGVNLEPPHSTPFLVQQLMFENCWKKTPSDRPTFSEIHAKLAGFSSTTSEAGVNSNCYTYLQPLPDLEQ